MKSNKRLTVSVVEILLGIGLVICQVACSLDEYWSGMGTALIVVGIIQLARGLRYKTNEAYRDKFDTQTNDERNRFIAMKAWSWAGFWFVMIAAVGSVVLKIVGLDEYVMFASGSVCLMMVLYWLSWLYLRKKY